MLFSFSSKVRAASFVSVAAVLAIAVTAPAFGRVGVTSQTDGDPLGKPPTQNERVLRVGIDIQANELITTKGDDRAHIVFLDGTALTVAPNARQRCRTDGDRHATRLARAGQTWRRAELARHPVQRRDRRGDARARSAG